ncbi:MAG: 16S rRNA (adenine(1518)-N(6)/adenine(1519)-N(6))-dimethyltransferase RsmA [Alphaproteobacteria bacterium]
MSTQNKKLSVTDKVLNLPPLRVTLERFDLQPKKSMGQNFLLDLNITQKIARQAGRLEGANVLEIGPGPGGLTRAILGSGVGHLTVVEKDARCLGVMAELSELADGSMSIRNMDALELDIGVLDPKPQHIIANLPYNVATPLLIGWLRHVYDAQQSDGVPSELKSMVLMFQKEVGERIYASAGGKTYGRLAILSQWLCQTAPCFELPPEAFTPPPKVTSIVVKLEPRAEPLFPATFEEIESLAQTLFGQRRKMLRQTLKKLTPNVAETLEKAGIDGTRRAETLELMEFGALLTALRG